MKDSFVFSLSLIGVAYQSEPFEYVLTLQSRNPWLLFMIELVGFVDGLTGEIDAQFCKHALINGGEDN